MSYPGYSSAPNYGYAPPRRKRGMKRIVFGILGILANTVGLFLMPVIGGFIGIIMAAVGLLDLQPLSPDGGTFETSTTNLVTVWVPADEAPNASCAFEGGDLEVTPSYDPEISIGELDGVEYVEIYTVQSFGDATVTMTCTDTSAAAYSTMGMLPTFILAGVGAAIAIGLGIIALIMLIWGIVARIRS
ncbi:hypothetical protein ACXET9_02320 [Brachybacterium sp. DNPG3]